MTTPQTYFRDHPDARDGVLKAYYAYHAPHFRCEPTLPLHNFTNAARWSRCAWCGRSREEVRHDDQPAHCTRRPDLPTVTDVLRGEEVRALAMTERAARDVPAVLRKLGMTGEALAVLHHTYGHDPETVATIATVPQQLLADYHAAMDAERERSKAAHVRERVTAES